MGLPSPSELAQQLIQEDKASNRTERYKLWQTYKDVINPVPPQASSSTEISNALQLIESIQYWHPEWLSSYIDFDLDMYTACGRQSRLVVNAMHAYQQTPNTETSQQYHEALADLRMLSALAGDTNESNYVSRWLLGVSGVMMLGLYVAFPTMFLSALISSLYIIPIVLLVALSVFLTGGFDLWYYPAMFSLINLAVFLAVSIGIVGLVMNLCNPSPQGSVKLAHAMDDLISACETYGQQLSSAEAVEINPLATAEVWVNI